MNLPFFKSCTNDLQQDLGTSNPESSSSKKSLIIAIIAIFAVALSVRLIWTFYVQHPGDAIYSDMRGYVGRAEALASGIQEHDQKLTFNPYGTHYLYALEMLLFGRENYTAMSLINVLFGSVAVVFASLYARRCFSSTAAMWIVGILSSAWYPFVVYNGYFSSEIPYAFFLYLSLFLTYRLLDTGKGYILTGLIYGMAFSVRPQVVMTALLLIIWIVFRRKQLTQIKLRKLVLFALPFLFILGYSVYRYHYFTGEYALINNNGHITRLFGATKYRKAEAVKTLPDGTTKKRYIAPPATRNLGYTDIFKIDGYISDREIIDKEIKRYQSQLSFWEKASLKWRNVSLLAYRNTMWPERNQVKKTPWRKAVFQAWPVVIKCYWFPLACFGLLTLILKRNLYLEIAALHFVTMLYAAYAYLGEIRYRIPYDPLLTVFMLQGAFVLFRIKQNGNLKSSDSVSEYCKQIKVSAIGLIRAIFTNTRQPDKPGDRPRSVNTAGLLAVIVLFVASVFSVLYGSYSLYRFGIKSHKSADVYYDAVHGARHLWNRSNKRFRYGYHTVSGFSRFCKSLQKQGFDLHAEDYKDFNRKTLDKYDVFFVGEQTYHSKYMTDRQQEELMEWVKDGGSLFALVEHTNAHYMGELVNGLLKDTQVKVRFDSIMDLYRKQPSTRTTWVTLPTAKEHPVTKDVEEYHFMNGASLDTPHGVLFSADTSWSDEYNKEKSMVFNGNRRRDPNEISGPLAGAAALEYGKGKIVVIGDHNAFSNPNLYYGDHHLFIMNCMKWLAGKYYNYDIFYILAGISGIICLIFAANKVNFALSPVGVTVSAVLITFAVLVIARLSLLPKESNFLVHTGNSTDINYMTRAEKGYYAFYGQWTKEPQLYPWASKTLKSDYDSLFLTAPTAKYTKEQMEIIDDYLAKGRKVVYLATSASLKSEAGRQLQDKFQFKVKTDSKLKLKNSPSLLNVYGDDKWTRGFFKCYRYKKAPKITVEGLEPLVRLSKGDYRRSIDKTLKKDYLFDLLSSKKVGRGQFLMLAPMELFDNKGLSSLYKDGDVIREQMAELIIRLGKFTCGDNSVYYTD